MQRTLIGSAKIIRGPADTVMLQLYLQNCNIEKIITAIPFHVFAPNFFHKFTSSYSTNNFIESIVSDIFHHFEFFAKQTLYFCSVFPSLTKLGMHDVPHIPVLNCEDNFDMSKEGCRTVLSV